MTAFEVGKLIGSLGGFSLLLGLLFTILLAGVMPVMTLVAMWNVRKIRHELGRLNEILEAKLVVR